MSEEPMTVPESIEEVNKSESCLRVGLVVLVLKKLFLLRFEERASQGFSYLGGGIRVLGTVVEFKTGTVFVWSRTSRFFATVDDLNPGLPIMRNTPQFP